MNIPLLRDKAKRILILLSTLNLYEAGFSMVGVIKIKYRAKVNVEMK